ncbi:MAG TPA: lytic transglycosylase domain-containing protein, partial [Vicinamibacteria bacterium]
ALPAAASADIALLSTGATMKVSAQRLEGDTVVLMLKGGGEVGVPASMLRGVVPDEVLDEIRPSAEGDVERLVAEAAQRHGLDPALVMAVVGVESGFQPQAVSPKGARGLMQLMPRTAREMGVADPFDPAANLDGGSRYLSSLVARFEGDLTKALAAYNAGMGAVARHGGVPPYAETRKYVQRVLGRYQERK